MGLRQNARAIDHWEKFIRPLPAGPWRAQAYIKIIDSCLEEQFDLPEASKYANLARGSLATALADEKAGESWKSAAFDVQLRVGLVSVCEGKNAIAAEAFEAAKKLTDKKTTAGSLDSLIAAARTGKPVIPGDCAGVPAADGRVLPSGKAALALSMGVIHLLAGHNDNADTFFGHILGTPAGPGSPARPPMPGATPAQLAFAAFGKGAVLQAQRKPAEAKEQFLTSIKAFGDGSWHDKTLYRLATLDNGEGDAKAKELLEYWMALTHRYPHSSHHEEALLRVGTLSIAVENPVQAMDAFEKLVSEYADGPYTGKVLLFLGQHALFEKVDGEQSRNYFQQLDRWIAAYRNSEKELPRAPMSHPRQALEDGQSVLMSEDGVVREKRRITLSLDSVIDEADWTLDELEAYCAGIQGLLCFVDGDLQGAMKQFNRIPLLDTAIANAERMGQWNDFRRLKTGVKTGYLLANPEELGLFNKRQRLAVSLADFYYLTEYSDEASLLFQRLHDGDFGRLTSPQQDYVIFGKAKAEFRRDFVKGETAFLNAIKDFEKILKTKDNTLTEYRAALSIAVWAEQLDNHEKLLKRRHELLRGLAYSTVRNRYTFLGRSHYALALIRAGNREEGLQLLRDYPDDAESMPYHKRAKLLLRELENEDSELSRDLAPQAQE